MAFCNWNFSPDGAVLFDGPAHHSDQARTMSMLFLSAIGLYALAGLFTALAFVTMGVTRVLPHPAPVTIGARILLIPAAAALWPYVLYRWRSAGRAP
jgi:hypothetical protein